MKYYSEAKYTIFFSPQSETVYTFHFVGSQFDKKIKGTSAMGVLKDQTKQKVMSNECVVVITSCK